MRTGGLAELLRSQVAYAAGWASMPIGAGRGVAEFYALAKRLRNRLHGQPDHGPFGAEIRSLRARTRGAGRRSEHASSPAISSCSTMPRRPAWRRRRLAGARVIWRCHVGRDVPNDAAREAWDFLLPYVSLADAYVFSRPQFTWEMLDRERSFTIPPVINPIAQEPGAQ